MKQLKYISVLLFMLMALGPAFASATEKYCCPPCGNECDQMAYAAPGKCPHCGMTLVAQTLAEHEKLVSPKKNKVLFFLQDGVKVLDFAGPMEVFTDASFEVSVVCKTKAPMVSQGVLKITPDYSMDDTPHADILAFFGGNADSATNDPEVIAWVKKQTDPEYYFSVCTGALYSVKPDCRMSLRSPLFTKALTICAKPSLKVKCWLTSVL